LHGLPPHCCFRFGRTGHHTRLSSTINLSHCLHVLYGFIHHDPSAGD
jgi:hypothetical protein